MCVLCYIAVFKYPYYVVYNEMHNSCGRIYYLICCPVIENFEMLRENSLQQFDLTGKSSNCAV